VAAADDAGVLANVSLEDALFLQCLLGQADRHLELCFVPLVPELAPARTREVTGEPLALLVPPHH
jgi:hypothetical protein